MWVSSEWMPARNDGSCGIGSYIRPFLLPTSSRPILPRFACMHQMDRRYSGKWRSQLDDSSPREAATPPAVTAGGPRGVLANIGSGLQAARCSDDAVLRRKGVLAQVELSPAVSAYRCGQVFIQAWCYSQATPPVTPYLPNTLPITTHSDPGQHSFSAIDPAEATHSTPFTDGSGGAGSADGASVGSDDSPPYIGVSPGRGGTWAAKMRVGASTTCGNVYITFHAKSNTRSSSYGMFGIGTVPASAYPLTVPPQPLGMPGPRQAVIAGPVLAQRKRRQGVRQGHDKAARQGRQDQFLSGRLCRRSDGGRHRRAAAAARPAAAAAPFGCLPAISAAGMDTFASLRSLPSSGAGSGPPRLGSARGKAPTCQWQWPHRRPRLLAQARMRWRDTSRCCQT